MKLGTDFAALRHLVATSVTTSVTRSTGGGLSKALLMRGPSQPRAAQNVHSQAASGRNPTAVLEEEDEEEPIQVPLETVKPRWDTPGWLDQKLDVRGQCPDMPRHSADTLRNMMTQDDNIKLGFIQLEISARSKPFSKGAMRTASYARTSASNARFAVKTFIKEQKSMAFVLEEMRGQTLCKAFALEFNALLDPKYSLDFVVSAALQPRSQAGTCISIEPFIDEKYIKYNNNGGWINEDLAHDPCNQAAQAFSHFTFERSWAIQTKDPKRFELCDANMNIEGFKFFFASPQV
ncbi:kinase-like domain-containing protein [Xylariaceae sp. FL0255]|nr:kinase-like domain-containing protein [Xylariaceae sp. FL0255]